MCDVNIITVNSSINIFKSILWTHGKKEGEIMKTYETLNRQYKELFEGHEDKNKRNDFYDSFYRQNLGITQENLQDEEWCRDAVMVLAHAYRDACDQLEQHDESRLSIRLDHESKQTLQRNYADQLRISSSEMIASFIHDLLGDNQSNGSDERDLADQWYCRNKINYLLDEYEGFDYKVFEANIQEIMDTKHKAIWNLYFDNMLNFDSYSDTPDIDEFIQIIEKAIPLHTIQTIDARILQMMDEFLFDFMLDDIEEITDLLLFPETHAPNSSSIEKIKELDEKTILKNVSSILSGYEDNHKAQDLQHYIKKHLAYHEKVKYSLTDAQALCDTFLEQLSIIQEIEEQQVKNMKIAKILTNMERLGIPLLLENAKIWVQISKGNELLFDTYQFISRQRDF